MATAKANAVVYLLPGMTAKVKVPDFYVFNGERDVPAPGGGTRTATTVNGFILFDEDVGSIEAVDKEPAVMYTHKKYDANKIFYFSRTGEQAVIDIIGVPIHDHSSVVTGGPAYGTYFTDDETLGDEE
jgi:hypothetical protein